MSSNGEDIIRETFEKFGDAIGVQMQIPNAMIANLGAVLQAQIDLLAELHSTGRLVPAGGMALTAEEFADLHNMIWEGRGDLSSRDRLRERFPENRDCRLPHPQLATLFCTMLKGHEGTHFDSRRDVQWPPAPAEPAEEETKAEVPDVLWATLGEVLERWKKGGEGTELYPDQVHPLIQRGYIAPSNGPWTKFKPTIAGEKAFAASSPVVPAPTETGPWQTWQEVPEGVVYTSNRTPFYVWENINRVRHFRRTYCTDDPMMVSEADERTMQYRAPFVAAEEG